MSDLLFEGQSSVARAGSSSQGRVSDGMDWITRLGMLTAATASETPDPTLWQDQEDHT